MVGWHHQLNGHEFEQAPGGDEGQGSLGCCSPWGSQRVRCDQATEQEEEDSDVQRSLVHCSSKGCNELDMTLQLSNNLLLTLLSPAAFHYIYF